MQLVHKEILIRKILDKNHRTDSIKLNREESINLSVKKNLAIRDLIIDVAKKQDWNLQPVTLETHKEEWKHDLKK